MAFDAAPLDCAAEGVSAHLPSWRESRPIPRRRLRDLAVEVRLLDRPVDTLCSVETDFNLLALLVYLLYEYKILSTIFVCDVKKGLSTGRSLGSGPSHPTVCSLILKLTSSINIRLLIMSGHLHV